jgi:protein-S-isoprenylcysteine O-methyltransferase Ste14
MDRAIALVALLPFAYVIYQCLHFGQFPIEVCLVLAQLSILVVTMATRRAPKRVALNPWVWLLSFVASYWSFFTGSFYGGGVTLVPRTVSVLIAVAGCAISIWARLSLGRNIGFVPAERQIVSSGAYAWARHPIYTALFIGLLAKNLAYFSVKNMILDLISLGLWVVKTFVEEAFLKRSPAYADYMKKVRWRWFPWIA